MANEAVKEKQPDTEVEKTETEVAEENIEEGGEAEGQETQEELDAKSQAAVNKRFGQLTSKIENLEAKLAEKDEKKEEEKDVPAKKTEPTIEELEAWSVDAEHPEYHSWALRELAKRYARREVEEYKKSTDTQTQFEKASFESFSRGLLDFPEILGVQGSEGWNLAEKIYFEEGLQKLPNGKYIAAKMAHAEMLGHTADENKDLKRKVSRANAKTGLAGSSSAPSSPSRDATKLKLFMEAKETGNWRKYNEWTEKNPVKP